ncbi:hypothetical protein LTR64_008805 [Lithohypha guttulata]|uniref:uncharacterized protein n=1 Tax=Lithohypha guttulata TaxID=1690604 RepID=UPI00315CCF16
MRNAPTRFAPTASEGTRIIPSRSRDAELQLRIDAGHHDESTKRLNVVLQVNSQATSPALREYVKKNSTHGKLATASFDTSAEDKDAEFKKMLAALEDQARAKLG